MDSGRRRLLMVVALVVCAGFAAWSLMRPYQWRPDPDARCTMVAAQVRVDRSYFWLDLHLKVAENQSHDLMKPVRLLSSGREIEPADTTMGGTPAEGTTDLWFKFWLEPHDFEGPLELKINDGVLRVRSGAGIPSLGR